MNDFLYHGYQNGITYWHVLKEYPSEIRYFIISAMLFIILSIMLVIVLYLRRWYLLNREKKEKTLKFRFQYFIYDALIESSKQELLSSTDLIINKFKRNELNTRLEKQLMIDLMIELKKSFSGNSKRQFQHLYLCLGLHHESIARLSSRDILQKIKGIRELSEMDYQCDALEQAFKSWQICSNPLLADEVKLAAIKSGSVHMLSFLYHQKEALSPWLCIQLRHHLESLPAEKVPHFSPWLNVEEPSSLIFVLQMIALFKQDAAEHVIPLLYHPDQEVSIEAIKTLEILEARKHIDALFNVLDCENISVKITAICTIGKLGNSFHANLLRPLLQQKVQKVSTAVEEAIQRINLKTGSIATLSKTDHFIRHRVK